MPWAGIVGTNVIIGAFVVGWLYFVYRYVQDPSDWTFAFVGGGGIGIFTLALFTAITVGSYRYSQAQRGWLVIDRAAGTVTLSRQNRVVPIARLLRIEHLNMGNATRRGNDRARGT